MLPKEVPSSPMVAVLSLALGIGWRTRRFFSLVKTRRPASFTLPVPNPQELRVIEWTGSEVHNTRNSGSKSTRRCNGAHDQAGRVFLSVVSGLSAKNASSLGDIFWMRFAPLRNHRPLGTRTRQRRRIAWFQTTFFRTRRASLHGPSAGPAGGRLPERHQTLVISHRWCGTTVQSRSKCRGQVSSSLNCGFNFDIVGVLPPDFGGVRSGSTRGVLCALSRLNRNCCPATRALRAERGWWVPAHGAVLKTAQACPDRQRSSGFGRHVCHEGATTFIEATKDFW